MTKPVICAVAALVLASVAVPTASANPPRRHGTFASDDQGTGNKHGKRLGRHRQHGTVGGARPLHRPA